MRQAGIFKYKQTQATPDPSRARAASQTPSNRPFPANPRRYNATKSVKQVFPREIRAGTRYNITKPVNRPFPRTNQHRSCRDRSPDLSARHNLPLTVHPPGDTQPHERTQTRRRTAPPTKIRPTVAGRTGERPLHYMTLHPPLNKHFPQNPRRYKVQHNETRQTGLFI